MTMNDEKKILCDYVYFNIFKKEFDWVFIRSSAFVSFIQSGLIRLAKEKILLPATQLKVTSL